MQRLETAELTKLLAEEGHQLQRVSDQASKQCARAQELRSHASAQGIKLASIMEGIGALLGLVSTALEDESFAKDMEAAAEAQTVLENDSLGTSIDAEYFGASARGGGSGKSRSHRQRRRPRRGLPSAAERVRAAPHRKRTSDEKRWVALDAVMNPKLYHHVTLAEAEEMRWDTLYYTRLDRDDIVRVLALPTQIQLALPFLHTPAEVDAHELLGRYTLGVGGDHFARLDKNSQDACITGSSSALAKVSETASEEGAGAAAEATAGPEEIDATTVPRRVLACMRRGVEAQLKLSTERSEEEAVWLVLDRKLRSILYQDEDDAAGEQSEELHREADAKEDARHTWLVTSQKEAGGGPNDGALGSVVEQPERSVDIVAETATGTTVVGQRESQEDLATRMGSAFSENDVKRLAVGGLSSDCGQAGLTGTGEGAQLSTLLTVSATEKADDDHNDNRNDHPNDLHNNLRNDLRNDVRNDLRNVEGGVNEAGGLDNANKSWSIERGDENDEKTFAGVTVTVPDGRVSALESSSSARKNENAAKEDRASEQQETDASKTSLQEAAHHVLSRFFVREEETPLGRCMTRSLAVLQEVTLRLCRGQRDVFSGLNEQTAYAILLSSSRGRTFGGGSSPSVVVAATTPATTAATEGGKGIFAPNEEHHPPAVVTPTCTGAENTSVTSADKAPSSASFRESASGSGSRSDSTNGGTGRVHARGSGGDGSCVDSAQAAAPPPAHGAIQNSACRESRNSTGNGGGDGGGREEVGGAGGSAVERERKVFGSWEEVHPASLGIRSQEKNFSVSGVGEGIEEQAHPASFRSSASEGITHTYYQYATKHNCRILPKLPRTLLWAARNSVY